MENKYNLTAEDNIMYAKRNIVDSIYSEARLEGVGVTYPDTQEIYEGRAVAGLSIEETIKVNNLKHAWQFILENIDYPLNLRFVRQLNQEIGRGIVIDAENLRRTDVKIGGTLWKPDIPNEEEVVRFFDGINSEAASATDVGIDVMLYIMRAQLFMDGNKRTAQLAANKIMISYGAGIISIPVDRQRDFLSLLINYYETADENDIKQFIYDFCIDGFDSYAQKNKSL
ncbi:MAG: Fic family protein [Ruminococcus sp.]|nr:Fic family protein [Ruminococcus sp.]